LDSSALQYGRAVALPCCDHNRNRFRGEGYISANMPSQCHGNRLGLVWLESINFTDSRFLLYMANAIFSLVAGRKHRFFAIKKIKKLFSSLCPFPRSASGAS
jgi:hypothetical protein